MTAEAGSAGRPEAASDLGSGQGQGPLARYRALVGSGAIAADPSQAMAAE